MRVLHRRELSLLLLAAMRLGCTAEVPGPVRDLGGDGVERGTIDQHLVDGPPRVERRVSDGPVVQPGQPRSRLGLHVLGSPLDGSVLPILEACPRVVKWLSGLGTEAIDPYKQGCPGGVVVLRVYVPPPNPPYQASDDPAAKADAFWNAMKPGLDKVNKASVDWLEGPNELDGLADWYHDWTMAQWFAQFWSRLADRMNEAGYHPLVGAVAVGNPALKGELGGSLPGAMQPLADVMKSKSYPFGWSYHGYSMKLSKDVGTEIWTSLRYRTIRDQCGLSGVPLVLTEGGQDSPGGWQAMGTDKASYLSWLKWYDAEIQKDKEVVGVTIFQGGNHSDWKAFDVGPIASDLAAYLRSTAN